MMRMMLKPLFITSFIQIGTSLCLASLSVPIPKTEPGTHFHSGWQNAQLQATVKLEVFLDIHCPDSLRAWTEIQKVAQHYGRDKVEIIIHLFPLPYHEYSQLATQGFYMLRDFVGNSQAFDYMKSVMERSYFYGVSVTENFTRNNIKGILADQAVEASDINRQEFIEYVDYYKGSTILAWKYAARRGVAGTPWYFINGVDLNENTSISLERFEKILDSLLE